MQKSNKWILFYLTENDTVKYISSDYNNVNFLFYGKFLEFITKFEIKNYLSFIEEFKKFNLIIFFVETGKWEIKKFQNKNFSFEEIVKIQNIKNKKKKNYIKDQVDKMLKTNIQEKKGGVYGEYKDPFRNR